MFVRQKSNKVELLWWSKSCFLTIQCNLSLFLRALFGTSYVQRMNRREIKGEASIKDLALVAKHKEVEAKVDNPIWPRSPTPITTEPPKPLLLTGPSCAFLRPLLCFFLAFLPKCSRRDIHSYRCVSIVSVLRAKGNAARGLSSTQPAQISLHIGPIPPQLQPTQPNSTPTNPTMP